MIGRPAYQRVADDLRSQIVSGALPVGQPLPSTARLVEHYEVSTTVVRAAIKKLQNEGLVYGQPGKAVYVRTTPDQSRDARIGLEDLARDLSELRDEVSGLSGQRSPSDVDELREEVDELRRTVGLLQTRLIDLYARTGQPYPHDEARRTETGERRRASGDR
ncbi:winged helix-turn-helix domain-containing protein [Actinacidiphila oryziradicis]|jgi:DNA-binding GntR family transcriptional regulator|uniref:winged helix-turn-helix domain-containing protein n=1 Tax=Actinacidiphila oryziradicis TaxID=2571141 RepID=UPI0023F0DA5D|nr:winged helix-turn-helix domain-containing protein [Actinacidiphila oryziradicis]